MWYSHLGAAAEAIRGRSEPEKQPEKVVQKQRITNSIRKKLVSNTDSGFDGAQGNLCRGAEAVSHTTAGETERTMVAP